jgi:hypothetical protein
MPMSDRRQRRLICCKPHGAYFSSGWAQAHSKHCRARNAMGVKRANQKVDESEWLPPDPDCPKHPGEEYVGCRACERIAEERIQGDEMWEAME